ncbi:MAG TPA: hypothetical protein IGS37_05045 [Synechococcales cyanobacterium M55_K2018_004]|nr:hypothetical protein [Synechococcales cyanobacterium M55_K2018_004]
MSLDYCPTCNRKLGPPLKSSGRQVCAGCGWSDKPRQATASSSAIKAPAKEFSPDEIQKILDQATAEALNNMKPKTQQGKSAAKKKRFLFFG